MSEKKAIELKRRWSLGPEIGKGGFGRVFEALGDDGCSAAVKLIPKQPGADRELLFENLSGVRCVVPIIDCGEQGGYWALVMPRASDSLRAHLVQRGLLPPADAVPILADVATALTDLHGKVVHRDIKPENVLFLDGRWCLSDFGIARYAEASTAPDTHKWECTPPYNAPERWRLERATAASDVYSLGVMAFEMLTGHWPFPGPDFRGQHLNEEPEPLTSVPMPLAGLVMECLLKAPEARPTAANILARLPLILRPSSPGASRLQAANQAMVEQIGRDAAIEWAARSAAERRHEIVASASRSLGMIGERLAQSIRENAPTAVWVAAPTSASLPWTVKLGQAVLGFSCVRESAKDAWGLWEPVFDVIAEASVQLQIPADRFQYEGRGHSLWFCDAQEQGLFRWYETAFMDSPLVRRRHRQIPFALAPSEEAGKALSRASTPFEVAWPFTALEPGNEGDFLERWMAWFAQAAQGEDLQYPSNMPERSAEGSWRQ